MEHAACGRPVLASGERIRQARQARGLTQAQLATAIGVSRSAIAQWETDRTGQVGGNLALLARVLGVPLAALVPSEASTAALDSGERALLDLYRELGEPQRQELLRTALRLRRAG